MPALDRSQPTVPCNARRVLIVDDNPINRKVAQLMLQRVGIECSSATNGIEALAYVMESNFALVLMDCHMAVSDGFEATAAIRRWEREQLRRPVPIVAYSASTSREDRQRCAAAGMDDFLAKPVTTASLTAIVAKWLSSTEADADLVNAQAGVSQVQTGTLDENFDAAQLAEMRDIAGARFGECIDQFEAGIAAALLLLQEALFASDRNLLRQTAHQLKGSAATLGAITVAHYAFELERRAEEDHLEGSWEPYTALAAACSSALSILRTLPRSF